MIFLRKETLDGLRKYGCYDWILFQVVKNVFFYDQQSSLRLLSFEEPLRERFSASMVHQVLERRALHGPLQEHLIER